MKLLVIEGNTKERREETLAQSGSTTGESYAAELKSLEKDAETVIAYPVDRGWAGMEGYTWSDFDGAVITGSGLRIEEGKPAMMRQIEFVREALKGGVPFFGSCWGLQVLVVCAGGQVKENANGREVGVGRKIRLTEAGLSHEMYAGKQEVFDAVSIHMDHTIKLPDGAKLLASNDMSEVQSLEIEGLGARAWGVQYHPEFNLAYMANILDAFADNFVEAGNFPDVETVYSTAKHMRIVTDDPNRLDIRRLYGWHDDIVMEKVRRIELRNWLDVVVKDRMREKA